MTKNQIIASTILRQLGMPALYMMGVKSKLAIDNGVGIRFTASKKANYLRITLNAKDLYDVEFSKIRGTTFKVVNKLEDVFADQITELVEANTGLNLSL